MKKSFIYKNFKPPVIFKEKKFILEPLAPKYLKLDYKAIMSSVKHLQKSPTPPICDDWPSKDLTMEQDLKDLKWHEKEFKNKTSFAYTILNPDKSKCLGCVYIFPINKQDYDCEVYFWVTKEQFDKGFGPKLHNKLLKWLTDSWPFKKIIFPGRENSK